MGRYSETDVVSLSKKIMGFENFFILVSARKYRLTSFARYSIVLTPKEIS